MSSSIAHDTSDNSVTFSLAELAKLEEERLRSEDIQRARALEKQAREQREAEARRRAAEAEQLAAEAEARARRNREEAEEKARAEARQQAAVQVALIEAQAKARIEASNAERAHELAVIRTRAQGHRGRLQIALAAALGLVLCGGSVAAFTASQKMASLEQDAERLRDGQATLAREVERAKETELSALDRRYAALRAQPLIREAEETRATAEAALNAIDAKALNHDRLRAFSDALDALDKRLLALGKIAALDKRHADLGAWASERRQSDAIAAARSAADLAKATGHDDALRAYEAALDQARSALARTTAGRGPKPPTGSTQEKCVNEGDPMCVSIAQ